MKKRKIKPGDFTISNILRRVRGKGDLFKPVLNSRQRLDGAFEAAREMLKERRARGARA